MIPPWLGAIPAPDRSKRLFAVLVCHLDDSGEKRDPIATLAGYLGTAEEWAKFEVRARAFFKEKHVSYLHTVDLHQRRGEFKGWSRGDTHAFASELFGILADHAPVGVEFSVLKPQFNAKKAALGMKREGAPTTFCFKGLLNRLVTNEVMLELLQMEGVDLSFVVENGNTHNNAILLEFQRLQPFYPFLRSLTFEDKKKLVALQVSDFLAYFSRRLRCMDKGHRYFDDEHEFFTSATAPIKTHDHFLATDFHGEGPRPY
jgi:hypothetical protein